jgi:hypothetical protein
MSLSLADIVSGLTALSVVMGAFYALVKVIVFQFKSELNTKFEALEKSRAEGQNVWNLRMQTIEERAAQLEQDVRKILTDIPEKYVRREDFIRRESIIDAKLDNLALRLEQWVKEMRSV